MTTPARCSCDESLSLRTEKAELLERVATLQKMVIDLALERDDFREFWLRVSAFALAHSDVKPENMPLPPAPIGMGEAGSPEAADAAAGSTCGDKDYFSPRRCSLPRGHAGPHWDALRDRLPALQPGGKL